MTYIYKYNSPLGTITLASNGEALTGLWFDGQKYFGDTLSKEYKTQNLLIFNETIKWLDIYFSGKNPDFTPKMFIDASHFRRSVWEMLLAIPYGKIMTYGAIANKIAKQKGFKIMSAQAVGGAVEHNPISIIVPCHRVIGKNGSLTGYAGGIERKIKLLELERVDMSGLFVPKKGAVGERNI